MHRKGGVIPTSWLPCGWSEALVSFFSPLAISATPLENKAGPLGAWANGADSGELIPVSLSSEDTLGAVRTSPQAGAQAANRWGGAVLEAVSASGLRAVGSCSAVTCQCLPWGAGADGPVSPEGPGAGRQDALCVRGLGRGESGCVPSASPHPHGIGAPPCRLKGPQGSQSSSSPFLSGKAASVLGHWD